MVTAYVSGIEGNAAIVGRQSMERPVAIEGIGYSSSGVSYPVMSEGSPVKYTTFDGTPIGKGWDFKQSNSMFMLHDEGVYTIRATTNVTESNGNGNDYSIWCDLEDSIGIDNHSTVTASPVRYSTNMTGDFIAETEFILTTTGIQKFYIMNADKGGSVSLTGYAEDGHLPATPATTITIIKH